MRTICLQLQIGRTSSVSQASVSALMLRVAERAATRVFTVQRGRNYLNFLFESESPERTWQTIERVAFGHRRMGRRLRESTIVTVQGSRGWDNYRLLHHFDPRRRESPLNATRRQRTIK
jgi:hypothetical protein